MVVSMQHVYMTRTYQVSSMFIGIPDAEAVISRNNEVMHYIDKILFNFVEFNFM
jgi:hypothetical protein